MTAGPGRFLARINGIATDIAMAVTRAAGSAGLPIALDPNGNFPVATVAPLSLTSSTRGVGPDLLGLPNGNFEDAVGTPGSAGSYPVGWVPTVTGTGSTLLDTSAANKLTGANSVKMVLAAAADTVTYTGPVFPCGAGIPFYAYLRAKSSGQAARLTVTINYFTNNGTTANGSATLAQVTGLPAAYAEYGTTVTPPAGTSYAQIACKIDTAADTTVWVDEVRAARAIDGRGIAIGSITGDRMYPNLVFNPNLGTGLGSPSNPYTGSVGAPLHTIGYSESFAMGSAFHIGMLVASNRVNGTGHREAGHFEVQCAGANGGEQIVGLIGYAHAVSGSGYMYGLNSYAQVDSGCASTAACISYEADVDMRQACNVKVGIQVVDVATSTKSGTVEDVGIAVKGQAGCVGFGIGLAFGNSGSSDTSGQQLGVHAGGTFIFAQPSAVTLRAGIDFGDISGGFSGGAILLPGGANNSILWGTSGGGGSISSTVTSGGGKLIFGNNVLTMQYGGTNTHQFTNTDTYILTRSTDGSFPNRRVITGAANSGGSGYRTMLVEN